MKKKKICFIAQFPPPIHGLSKAVDTLFNSELNSSISSDGEFIFEKIDIKNNRKFLKNLNLIRKSNADIFYFTMSQTKGGNLRDLVIFKLLEWQHKKCLVHLHGGYYRTLVDKEMCRWQREKNYKAVSKLSGAIVLGSNLKWNFHGILSNEKIHVVTNCVDDQFLISNQEFNDKIQKIKTQNINQVLYLSNFIRSKGYIEVLKMAKLEKNRVDTGEEKKLHFNFAGKFYHYTEYHLFEEYIKSNDLHEFVSYHGIVDGQQKYDLLKTCDVFILPTRYSKEGQPISILEAMGNGMMIISTDHAGIPDIVKDDINGILIKRNDTINLIYKKLILISNERLSEISYRNRKYCEMKFSQQNYINTIKNIFANSN